MSLLQAKHIPLLAFTIPFPLLNGVRLGVAWRERVRNPRRASDDVIFVVRTRNILLYTLKLEKTKSNLYNAGSKLEGYHAQNGQQKTSRVSSMWKRPRPLAAARGVLAIASASGNRRFAVEFGSRARQRQDRIQKDRR
jgi:hypothetical protein